MKLRKLVAVCSIVASVFIHGRAEAELGFQDLNFTVTLHSSTPPHNVLPNAKINYIIVETLYGTPQDVSGALYSDEAGDASLTYAIVAGNTATIYLFDPLGTQSCVIPGEAHQGVSRKGCDYLLGGFVAAYSFTAEKFRERKPLLLPILMNAHLRITDLEELLDSRLDPKLPPATTTVNGINGDIIVYPGEIIYGAQTVPVEDRVIGEAGSVTESRNSYSEIIAPYRRAE